MDRPAEGLQEAATFGQLADRYSPIFFVLLNHRVATPLRPLLPCTPFVAEERRDVGPTRFNNYARVVGLACSPTTQAPSFSSFPSFACSAVTVTLQERVF